MYMIFFSGITFFISFFMWCMKSCPKSWKLMLLIICSLFVFTLSCYNAGYNMTEKYWNELEEKDQAE